MFVSCCEAKEDLDLLQYWYGRAYPWDAVGVRLTSVAERGAIDWYTFVSCSNKAQAATFSRILVVCVGVINHSEWAFFVRLQSRKLIR